MKKEILEAVKGFERVKGAKGMKEEKDYKRRERLFDPHMTLMESSSLAKQEERNWRSMKASK